MRRLLWLLVPAGCTPGPDMGSTPDGAVPLGTIAVATSSDDYAVGALALVDPQTRAVTPDVVSTHGDAVLAPAGDDLYVLNRLGADSVRRYTRDDLGVPQWEVSTGQASNPHGLARCGDALLVSRYESADLWLLDPSDGAQVGTVSLAAGSDADGLPEASDVVALGDLAVVGLQRLDRGAGWVAQTEGRAAVVDCAAHVVTAMLSTPPNPLLRPLADDGVLVVSDEGLFSLGVPDGALEGPWYGEADEGLVTDAAVGPDGSVVVILRDEDVHTVACAPRLGAPLTVATTRVQYLSSVVIDGEGQAWVAARRGWRDPTEAGGLLVVDVATCALTSDPPVRGTLAPFDVAVW